MYITKINLTGLPLMFSFIDFKNIYPALSLVFLSLKHDHKCVLQKFFETLISAIDCAEVS